MGLSAQHFEMRRQLQDLDLARGIQRSFLPVLQPTVEGFRVSAAYRPAYGVGGDFYDVIGTGPRRITAVIGDVSGKGVSGALLMARISSDIRRLVPQMTSPRQLMELLNQGLASLETSDLFVTALCATLDAARREVTLCNAGHVLPLVRRASGQVVALGAASGPPLGMFQEHVYEDETFTLEGGDVVLLMTDGVTEALHTSEDVLGRAALERLIGEAPPSGREINSRILGAIDAPRGMPTLDDIALLSFDLIAERAHPRMEAARLDAGCHAC